jgi:hypothetical protein
MQHFLKSMAGTTRTEIIPTEFLEEFLAVTNDPESRAGLWFQRGILYDVCCSVQTRIRLALQFSFQMDCPSHPKVEPTPNILPHAEHRLRRTSWTFRPLRWHSLPACDRLRAM